METELAVADMSVSELKREEQVLRAWIRDVNAPKKARLAQISAELRGRNSEIVKKCVAEISRKLLSCKTLTHDREN